MAIPIHWWLGRGFFLSIPSAVLGPPQNDPIQLTPRRNQIVPDSNSTHWVCCNCWSLLEATASLCRNARCPHIRCQQCTGTDCERRPSYHWCPLEPGLRDRENMSDSSLEPNDDLEKFVSIIVSDDGALSNVSTGDWKDSS
ncbi:hypothetical protein B0J13DRAFT_206080 [Dactylonectria estremocensis]|uniref:IBR domain-containing protein n=1 Tax=Dactylonectria estremocensis TaxID=1079267 RepID=A0A9P9DAS3_9HYPO|nr:hypothetical protein B0J13DRAFT_206080 [Dactylonectria estremocensis]